MMVKGRRALVLAGVVLAGVASGACAPRSVGRPPCPSSVVTVSSGYDIGAGEWVDAPIGCDVVPPQRLDVAYTITAIGSVASAGEDCSLRGGRFVDTPQRVSVDPSGTAVQVTAASTVCEGVDY